MVQEIRTLAQRKISPVLDVLIPQFKNAPTTRARDEARENIVEAVLSVSEEYGSASATVAADVFDAIMEEVGADAREALVTGWWDEAHEYQKASERVRSAATLMFEKGNDEAFQRAIENYVAKAVGFVAHKVISDNVVRNHQEHPGMRYARVPTGAETCDFCLMLASRGFVYHSIDSAGGGGNHYHHSCDCLAIPGFDTHYAGWSRRGSLSTEIEGYDPDALYERYLEKKQDEVSKYKQSSRRRKSRHQRDVDRIMRKRAVSHPEEVRVERAVMKMREIYSLDALDDEFHNTVLSPGFYKAFKNPEYFDYYQSEYNRLRDVLEKRKKKK